jgi:CHAT domain-containing protein/Flp pilus assembly protein TadD
MPISGFARIDRAVSVVARLAALRGSDRLRVHRTTCGALASAALVALCGCRAAAGDTPMSQRWIDVLLAERFTVGRLARQTVWQPCVDTDTTALVPRARCGEPLTQGTKQFARIETVARDLRRIAGLDSTIQYFRAAALLELRSHDTSLNRVDAAIAALERARRVAPRNFEILNDLAVAYLERGARDQQLDPMLRALDVMERAVERDSTSTAALFNRALILERLYMTASAIRAWRRYLAVESDEPWRTEASSHLARLTQNTAQTEWPKIDRLPGGGDSVYVQIAGLAARAPQNARDYVFKVLREWGIAVDRHDEARGAAFLAVARRIGRELDRLDVDKSISLAVDAIDTVAGDPTRTRTLASAHVDLADGIALYRNASLDSAIASLTRAERGLRRVGSPAAHWAAFYHATTEVDQGKRASADTRFERLLAESAPNEPALRGKVVWGLGVNQLRSGNYDLAIQSYRLARADIARAREPENEAAFSYLLAEALDLAGQSWSAHDEAYRGLRALSPFRKSVYLNNHLTTVAIFARREGLDYAALATMQEVLDIAPRLSAQTLAWAHRAHARELIALGRQTAARAALEEASGWADRVAAGPGRDRVRADVQLVNAQLTRERDPRRARADLAAVVAAYDRQKLNGHLAAALYEMSIAAEALGDHADARQSLDRAISAIERQSGSFTNTEVRATFTETVENVFDAMMDLQLQSDHADSAFAYLERGRMAAWFGGMRRRSTSASPDLPTLETVRALLPPNTVVVEYALLRDRFVTWTISSKGWRPHVTLIGRDSLAALVDRVTEELENRNADSTSARARLFDLLIRPLAGEFRGIRSLSVIPDRELSRLPFVALWDTAKKQYLVEGFEVRTVPSGAFLMTALKRRGKPPAANQALVVGDPLLDTTASARLPALPGASEEAQRVAKQYRSPRLLTGGQARRDSVVALLATSSVFHFAGHAIVNTDQPELSYLAFAKTEGGDNTDGMLRAREIGQLRPSKLQLVVLSACSTLSPRASHTGAIAGLAYSFLRAGVPATVSTLWDVSDETTVELLVDFHHELVAGRSAAEALQSAQRAAIKRSPPRVWAAFIYTGP